MDRLIILNSLAFYDSKKEFVVRENTSITFSTEQKAEKHIQARFEYWSNLYDMKLKMAPDKNQTIQEVQIKTVFRLVAEYFNISADLIFKRRGKTKIIEAKRYAIGLLSDIDIGPSAIQDATGYDHATAIHHRDKFYYFCDNEKGYYDTFIDMKDYVMSKLGGKFSEDGSGKPEQDETS